MQDKAWDRGGLSGTDTSSSADVSGGAGASGSADVSGGAGMSGSADEKTAASDLQVAALLLGYVYGLFWADPTQDALDDLAAARDRLLQPPFSSVAPAGAQALHQELTSYACGDPQSRSDMVHGYRQDRTYLFYQVGYSRTSPYESVYRTSDHTMFGPTTAQVKADYERLGLHVQTDRNEPADHFALECCFVAAVADAGAQAAQQGDAQAAEGARVEIRDFLSRHLLVFAPVYLGNFETRAHDDFYRAASVMAGEVLRWAAHAFGAHAVQELDPADFPLRPRDAGHEG